MKLSKSKQELLDECDKPYKHFAWWPVKLVNESVVWLETVNAIRKLERVYNPLSGRFYDSIYVEYYK